MCQFVQINLIFFLPFVHAFWGRGGVGFQDFNLDNFSDFTPGKPKKAKQEAPVASLPSTTPANESKQDGPSLSSSEPGSTNLPASNRQAVMDPTD